jgi:hypothetical protein
MFRILRDYIISAVGLAAGLIAITGLALNVAKTANVEARIGLSVISFFALWYFGETMYLQATLGRASKYGSALSSVNLAFSFIHALDSETLTLSQVSAQLNIFCDHVAKAFTTITGAKCSCCIKVLTSRIDEHGVERLAADTVFRDTESLHARPIADPRIIHWVEENSDFAYILERFHHGGQRYFLGNRLPFKEGYRNTSFRQHDAESLSRKNAIMRYLQWPLLYRSAIVAPICSLLEREKQRVVGFICVDSNRLNVFKRAFDVDLLFGIADGIHAPLEEIARNSASLTQRL